MEKFKKIFYYFILFILLFIIICGNIENGVVLSVLSFVLIYFFVNKVKIKNFSLFLIVFCLITKIVIVFLVDTPITGDFVLMYDTAKHIISDGIYAQKHFYFNFWGYQLFHVFYETIMLTICDSAYFLKILNCIYSTVITFLVYLISKKITNESAARITSLLYAISFYPLYLNTILGNQQLALMFAMIAIYLLLYKKLNLKIMILIGFLFAISHLERNEGIVYLLTSIIYLFISKKSIKDTFRKIIVMVVTFFIVTQGASLIVMKSGVNEIGLKNAIPEWKFLLGFNYETNGKYSVSDEVYLNDTVKLKNEVVNRITNIKKIPILFYNKTKIQFLYEDFGQSFDDINSLNINKFKTIIFNYVKTINILVIFLAFLGIIKSKKLKQDIYFFIINFLAFFGVYMLIEICARYYYNPQVTIFILSSLGINYVLKLFENIKKPL